MNSDIYSSILLRFLVPFMADKGEKSYIYIRLLRFLDFWLPSYFDNSNPFLDRVVSFDRRFFVCDELRRVAIKVFAI